MAVPFQWLPTPLGFNGSNNRLPARMGVDVLHRDFLLTLCRGGD
jgi:hypothetical protein